MRARHNNKKYLYLTVIQAHGKLSSRELTTITQGDYSDVSEYRHFYNTMRLLYRYTTEYTKPLLSRRKENKVYVYSLTKHGRKRLKQMTAAKAFFGVYKLKWCGVQLLVEKTHAHFTVNPDAIQYASEFCDVDPVKLWEFV